MSWCAVHMMDKEMHVHMWDWLITVAQHVGHVKVVLATVNSSLAHMTLLSSLLGMTREGLVGMAMSHAPEPGAVTLSKTLHSCVGMLAQRHMAVCVSACPCMLRWRPMA
jgi:hypothetical protein